MENNLLWKIIRSHFEDNTQSLVRHHIESYNDFYKTSIFQIFKEKNPIRIHSAYDKKIEDFRHQCIIYLGGKNGDKIYFGKPIIYDNENPHYMFPNEARLRNMTYGMTIHYDVEIEFIDILEPNQAPYRVDVDMNGGGDSRGGELELENMDYSQEIAEALEDRRANFKLKTDYTDEEMEQLAAAIGGEGEEDEAAMAGGAGAAGADKVKKVERKRRVKSVEVEMTTTMAEQLRESAASSMNGNKQHRTMVLEKIYLGKFPIMVQSEFCVLNGLPREMLYSLGECRNDVGGYFIIDGKEKTVVCQEKFGDNMLYIRKSGDDKYLYSAEIRSVSENVSKPIRTLAVKIMAPTGRYTFENIVVSIPNVRKPVPLFIVFRALGIISDKSIIEMCLLDLEKYESMLDLFIPSVHDAGAIMSQQAAILYIATLTKYGTATYAMEILTDYFLPHIGETNYLQKAYYLGHIVFRLLCVSTGTEPPTDRDNFKYKRIELVGSLLYDLFREYYTLQQREIHLGFEKRLYYNQDLYTDDLVSLIRKNYREVFRERVVEIGFKKAFKGNWGSQPHTKKVGIVQDLNRLSFNSAIAHLRKTNLPLDSSAKLVGPRVLHSSQWGFIDPIDTPDGGNIGLHKSLAIATYVSRGYSRELIIRWLREKIAMKSVEECGPALLSTMTKVFVNGLWAGSITDPIASVEKIHLFRRNALIPIHTSCAFDIRLNTVFIYTDAGRLCRPIFYVDSVNRNLSYEVKEVMEKIEKGDFLWKDLITGFNKKKIDGFENMLPRIYELPELYEGISTESNPARMERFLKGKAIIDYIDPSESENALIAVNSETYQKEGGSNKYTHMEIHESLIFGVMCNQIIFPENNPPTRNSFSCGQSKQAVSLYHTNHQLRMDKTAVVLNNGQVPLVKSRYMEYINREENPYGENAIVAIMCYTGYNVEDAILFNEGALKRGLFNTTYYTMYETHEESSKNATSLIDKKFTNIENDGSVVGLKPGYDYSALDKFGIIKEGTEVNDKTVLIGLTSNNPDRPSVRVDMSKTPKKGQLGVVDRSFITEGEEGERIAKVRVREIRIPNLGDKMASRAGQKGTVGLVIPECDMPFTKDGIRPDIIINPHAIPSRMTIGQLVETIVGKACVSYGAFGDCTAFNNRGSKIRLFGEHLTRLGFHSSGNEILYNGMTGEQIESDIFIGPNYYMRLKHMVKDKINYRALGPNTALTKQPVSGRANDGGLRIGEMERDVLLSHGITNFLRESMMERADKYYMAICNQTGMLAVYNPTKNLFISPMTDGPLQYVGSVDGKTMNVENVTKYGRNFSVMSVPYSFKLLIQELQTMHVQMRIITDDNIEQLENMMYSNNIAKLTHGKFSEPKEIMEEIKKALDASRSDAAAAAKRLATPLSIPDMGAVVNATNIPAIPIYGQEYEAPSASDTPIPHYVPDEIITGTQTSPVYVQTSPAYQPTSAELATATPGSVEFNPNASAPASSGGAATNSMDFSIGETVYYRGDSKSNRIWRVKDIAGGSFITIETDDVENIDDVKDTIRVVEPSDIYRPTDVIMAGGGMHLMHQAMMPQPMMQTSMPFGGIDHTPQININPVIKVVNGPDNSIDAGSDKPAASAIEGGIIPIKNAAPMLLGGGEVANKGIPSVVVSSGGATPAASGSEDINSGGAIDFSKLVIKKV